MAKEIKIGITIGDPSGIGPEIVLKSLEKFKQPRDCEIYIFADKVALIKNGLDKKNFKFNLINLGKIKTQEFRFGKLSKRFGLASFIYLNEAIKFIKKGTINCLVTAPVNKRAINLNNIKFSGHTEFLAKSFGVKEFVMMFVSENLKVSLVTRHIPLNRVFSVLSIDNIGKTIFLTYDALRKYFKIERPKIALCGLNPHASENGLMGREEAQIIQPAIEQSIKKINKTDAIFGPLASDTVFHRALQKEYDAVVCMYHDQGLIPFKMLDIFQGVNLTLGLPFIRTSPSHGTAFDIAGKNKADYHSMLEAIRLAYKLTKNKLRR